MNTLKIDRTIALAHLKVLGYLEGDHLFIRAIPGTGHNGATVKLEATIPFLPWEQLENLQQQGKGIYFVVNGQGHTDADVKRGKAVFYEHDNLPLDIQQNLWEVLRLPNPSIQVRTRKSIHTYYVTDCSVAEWRALQSDLLEHSNGDRSLKNPSRVLRLAGCWHVKAGEEPILCELIQDDGLVYSYQELRAIVPKKDNHQDSRQTRQTTTSYIDAIPLEKCLTKDDRSSIQSGSVEGNRNNTGAKLARNLIGTAKYLDWMRIQYHGDARLLFDDFCSRCSPPLPNREAETIWKSAQREDPTPSLAPEIITNCIKAWERKQNPQPEQHLPSVDERWSVDPSVDECWQENASNPYTESTSGFQVLSVATSAEKNNFKEIDETVLDFDLSLLPLELAQKLKNDASKFNIDPVTLWQYLLPCVASCMGGETWIDMSGFKVPNIIWTMQVMVSGGGKSRGKDLMTRALSDWQKAESESFQEKREDWKRAQKQGSRNDEDCPDSVEPKLRKYIFNVATPQAVVKRLADLEDEGCIWVRDELSGLFKSLNQFTGEGEGLEILLESWDGKGCAVDRVDLDNSYFIPGSRLNLAGGIQPNKVSEIFPDAEDSQGVLARFLIAIPKKLPVKRVKGHSELAEYLPGLYKWVLDQHWGTVTPTVEADDFFTFIVESFGNEPAPNNAIAAWMAKLAGQTARIALVLNALECYHNRTSLTQVLRLETLEKAYKIALYYRACNYNLHGQVIGNGISGILAKVQLLAERKGKVEMGDIYRNINAVRRLAKEEGIKISEFTLSLCQELAKLGKGRLFKEKNKFFYEPSTLNTRKSEAYAQQGFGTKNTQHSTNTQQHQQHSHSESTLDENEERF